MEGGRRQLRVIQGDEITEPELWHHEKDSTAVAGFEDGRGPRAKECRQTLEPGTGKEMTFPPEPPEGTQFY